MNTDTFHTVGSKWWLIILIILIGVPSAQAKTISGKLGSGNPDSHFDQIVFSCSDDDLSAGRARIRERATSSDSITDSNSVAVKVLDVPSRSCPGILREDNDTNDSTYSPYSTANCGSSSLEYAATIWKSENGADYYKLQIYCVNNGSKEDPESYEYTTNK